MSDIYYHARSMDDYRDWLTLIHAPGVGISQLQPLLDELGGATAVVAAGRSTWKQAGLSNDACNALENPSSESLARDLDWLAHENHYLIGYNDPAYAPRLREIARPPIALYAIGDPSLLQHPQLAIVGSRNPTREGRAQAHDFAETLAQHGLGITSGLALGIDAAAHEGALAAEGITIAVFGTGLDKIYPARHRDLATRIANNGLLVSEFPCGTEARPAHFPQRNRIVTGLSLGVLVVEAAERSGSLISARAAMEQGREVFAIPGSIINPLKRGCHRLIRSGAKLVESAQDVLEEIAPLLDNGRFALAENKSGNDQTLDERIDKSVAANQSEACLLDEEYTSFLALIGYEPLRVDEIVKSSGYLVQEVSSMLLMLELKGFVEQVPGGAYQRCKV